MKTFPLLSFLLAAAGPLSAAVVDVEIGGNSTGYMAFANVKNWGDEAAASNPSNSIYPYYQDGLWKSIAVGGLSSTNDYSAVTGQPVSGTSVTQADFATFSAGRLSYDNASLTGVGTETISLAGIVLNLNTGPSAGSSVFSPFGSAYNRGSGFGNFGWTYAFTASNFSGSGLTFTDGLLTSIDFTADIGVKVFFGNIPGLSFKDGASDAIYGGTLSFSGNAYAFDLDVTKTVSSALGTLTDTHMVITREGTIAGVVPEPSAALLGVAGVAFFFIRRRSSHLHS